MMFARLLVLVAALSPVLAACNTMEGLGRDVRAGGHAIERTAGDVKAKM